MLDRSRSPTVVVGLEIGTSKVCAVVGEAGPDDTLSVIGIGQCPSRGVRKGEITDPAVAEADVRAALHDAEENADVEIRSVFLGITGAHVAGLRNRGVHPVVSRDREIAPDDVRAVIRNARAVNVPPEHTVIHAMRQCFVVDGQEGVREPVGRLGNRLEVEMHVTHGNQNRIQNAVRLVNGLHLEVDNIAFNGLASALALLTREDKECGALVIDLGGGTTDFLVYAQGVVRLAGVVAVGGDNVARDLGHGLKVSQGRAEQLKVDHGAALCDDAVRGQKVAVGSDVPLPVRTYNLENVHCIMSARLEETLRIVREEVAAAGLLGELGAGVFLCGGGARTPRLPELAARVFGLPAAIARAHGVSGLPTSLDQPEFATAIGLVKFGANTWQQRRRQEENSWTSLLPRRLVSLFPVNL